MAILILAAGFLVAIAVPTTNGAVFPVPPVRILPQQLMERRFNLEQFIESKLVEHSQALEQLMRMSQTQSDDLKRLAYNVGRVMAKTRLPEKTGPHFLRSGSPSADELRTVEHKVPVYGKLLRNFIVSAAPNGDEPTLLVEEQYEPGEHAEGRSGVMKSNGNGLQPLLGVQVGVSVNKCPHAGIPNYPYSVLRSETRSDDEDTDDSQSSDA